MGLFSGFEHIVREREPLAPLTWLRIGGVAEYLAEPTSSLELEALVRHCRNEDIPVRILGGGSNLLVRDPGCAGLVVHLGAAAFSEISVAIMSLRPARCETRACDFHRRTRRTRRSRTAGRYPRHDRRSTARQRRHR